MLLQQFDHNYELADLEESILLYEDALKLQPTSHPDRSNSLCSYAATLSRSFDLNSQSKDTEQAILFY
jgi:hypothetical protein